MSYTLPSRSTLDLKHNEQLGFFKSERLTVADKIEHIDNLQKQLDDLKKQKDNKKLGINGFQVISDLEKQIKILKTDVEQIQTHRKEYNYLLKTGTVVHQYFDKTKNRNSRSNSNKTTPKRSLNDIFSKNNSNVRLKKDSNKNDTKTFKRAELNDEYLSKLDPNYIKEEKNASDRYYCYDCQCQKEIDYNESTVVCPQCGTVQTEVIDVESGNFGQDNSNDISNFAYKRINHFNEILSQVQATENTEIPQHVYDLIMNEMKKERRSDLSKLDYETVKKFLKKYRDEGYNKYYEHIYHIICRLNGIPPKKFTPIQIENLRNLFHKIQPSFDKHCPKSRSNFLSYNYILYKFCELLCYDDFLDMFPLLKSDTKLRDQEEVWKKICQDVEFQFIPTN